LDKWRVVGLPLLLVTMDLLAGLGVSLALYDQPNCGWRLGLRRWLLRLGAVIAAFVLGQWSFMLAGYPGDSITAAWPGASYQADLDLRIKRAVWFQRLLQAHPQAYDGLGLLDAALVGAVLAVGTTAGLLLADRWLSRWSDLVRRAGD
jgi:hypothetical protein